jgi:hypothetical protein
MSEAGRLYPPEGLPPLGPPAWPSPPSPPPPRKPRRWIPVLVAGVVAVAVGAVVAIAQVAGDDRDADAPSRSTTDFGEPPRASGEVPQRTAPTGSIDGNAFSDPQGTYTITLGPEWTEAPSAMVAEVETWAVGDPDGQFTPNVNVLTQDAPGLDLEEYMEASVASLGSIDGEVIDHAFVTGPSGRSLGLMEYVAQPPGVRTELHFIATFDLRDGTAVVATYTATTDQFDEVRPSVEPYLLTLAATG